jgi:hypothetical protein
VRSVDPSQVRLALLVGSGASLDSLEVSLTDRAGNRLLRLESNRIQAAKADEYTLILDFAFRFLNNAVTGECIDAGPPKQQWFLEIIARRQATNWATTNQAISRHANYMIDPAYLH